MASGFYDDVIKELASRGFSYWKPAKGSHEKWRHGTSGKILLVPRNLKSRHTANGILKDSGSSKKL
ncbi:MAG: type II toxin-antitoxin system HicA family toxin [Rhizobiaceae bacterium]|nr:type II toxin-antitoxin system HicA family toxin [Rhizobiaceae bacterium]